MQTVTINAKSRNNKGKGPSRQLRAAGFLPAIAYGKNTASTNLAIPAADLRSILLSKRGRNSVITLKVDGEDGGTVMVKEYTVHPVNRTLVHADFIHIDPAQAVEVLVPFQAEGKSKGEEEGGTLLVTARTLNVRCRPELIPEQLTADVSELEINDNLRVADLKVPEGIEVLDPLDQKLAVVAPPRVEAEPTAEAAEGEEGAAEGAAGEAGEGKTDDAAAKPAEDGDKS